MIRRFQQILTSRLRKVLRNFCFTRLDLIEISRNISLGGHKQRFNSFKFVFFKTCFAVSRIIRFVFESSSRFYRLRLNKLWSVYQSWERTRLDGPPCTFISRKKTKNIVKWKKLTSVPKTTWIHRWKFTLRWNSRFKVHHRTRHLVQREQESVYVTSNTRRLLQ